MTEAEWELFEHTRLSIRRTARGRKPKIERREVVNAIPLLIACCVPVLYFGNLSKQREYCLKVLEVNKDITKESRFLQERCGCFDLDELFAEHATVKDMAR